ncbi:MAG: plasmid pRiA4b ORF-3 family protein [bacterium]|nr:plasmid pRiA4b ORF-3 family protein [bacterium]
MATKRKGPVNEIYQLKVTLRWTKPPIWRRLLVPADMTLAQLHDVLQVAMGWEDDHLHDFRVGQQRFESGRPRLGAFGSDDQTEESGVLLRQVMRRTGAKATYTYDFGDSWEHSIVLEKRLPREAGTQYPACTGGKRACPPEDCGGIPGFYNLLEAIQDPDHEDYEEMLEWVGDDHDPEAFSIEAVNRRLHGRSRWIGS